MINNEPIINTLLSVGAKIKAKDKFGESVLHYAAKSGSENLIEKFVQSGLNVNDLDDLGIIINKKEIHFIQQPKMEKKM